MPDLPTHDVIIIGAGMAGLLAATVLAQQGRRVIIIEKENSPGGRMATYRIGSGLADYGAQFITVRTPEFQTWMDRWIDAGMVFEWTTGWSDGSLGGTDISDGHPRYAVRGGMRTLAEHLARPLEIQLGQSLSAIYRVDDHWQIRTSFSRNFSARALILTPPPPVALPLLDAGQVALTPGDRAALERITYSPALAGVFWVDGELRLPHPGAVQMTDGPISWIADNQRKGLSPDATLVTVHSSPEYSHQIWHLPNWEALGALESGLRLFRSHQNKTIARHLFRWTHAQPLTPHPERYLLAADLPPLVFSGDAFGHPRVEGAALSGLAAARALIPHLP